MPQGKVMIIGMDSATLDLVRPWVAEGKLPNFARFLNDGAGGPLRSTIPAMSPAAWSTFATGTNPGGHGVLDFSQLGPDSYQTRFNNAARRRGATFWEIAGEQGVSGGIINVPITYPPRAFNGFLISGLLSPAVKPDIATPGETFDDLMEICSDYAIDVDMVATGGLASEEFLRRAIRMTESRLKAALGLYAKHRPPLFCVVFVSPDRLCHYYWAYMAAAQSGRQLSDIEQRLARAVPMIYEKLDEALGALVEAAGDDTDVLVMSDHGAGPLKMGLNLHKALAARGLLVETQPSLLARTKRRAVWAFARFAPRELKGFIKKRLPGAAGRAASIVACAGTDFARSKAYPTGQSQGIFVNLKGRQPQGIVEPEDYESVRDEIIAALCDLKDPHTGQPVAKAAHRREEIWSGPCAESLPDVLLEQRDEVYDIPTFSEATGDGIFYDLPKLDPAGLQRLGGHRRDGLLLALGPHIRRTELSAEIADVPATVLALLGCSIPEHFDGRVLTEMLTDDVQLPETMDSGGQSDGDENVYSAEDEAALKERLKGLGYL